MVPGVQTDPVAVIEAFRSVVPIDSLSYYTNGGCYDFYRLLKAIYPQAEAWSDCNHVITKIDTNYYDITGKVECQRHEPIDPKEETQFLSRKA